MNNKVKVCLPLLLPFQLFENFPLLVNLAAGGIRERSPPGTCLHHLDAGTRQLVLQINLLQHLTPLPRQC